MSHLELHDEARIRRGKRGWSGLRGDHRHLFGSKVEAVAWLLHQAWHEDGLATPENAELTALVGKLEAEVSFRYSLVLELLQQFSNDLELFDRDGEER